ncbi:DUF3826 domain-containing protein [Arachidicoccus soli]|uniref:DUF3826 domain-containing protein n=1 Tax=Arachidicoccus soli TaxID=2341117 RepID=A0A386HNZ1_9BACT|nr:DUF3826 domain-containing protein [Arachidicoccus soli]AYD47658.1 DUF3826 domain-containing protein [Arachidicoccus soli]
MLKNKLVGKIIGWSIFFFAIIFNTHINAQTNTKDKEAIEAKASSWVASLNLNDKAKVERVTNLIATHLEAVRDWNNTHSFTSVPAGINPETGNKLSDLDRQIIVNSTIPSSVHENLMNGLRKDLNEQQVDAILDKYTVGKVAFTLKGYEAIVPDLTDKEKEVIISNLKTAREQAIDYKSMKQISAIFGIYKSKNEQYLNDNGRNWRQLYKAYYNKMKAEKAAKKVK